jgi:hypothetical protein
LHPIGRPLREQEKRQVLQGLQRNVIGSVQEASAELYAIRIILCEDGPGEGAEIVCPDGPHDSKRYPTFQTV